MMLERYGKLALGAVVLFIGIVFLLQNFNLLPGNAVDNLVKFWPVILIVVGFSLAYEFIIDRRN